MQEEYPLMSAPFSDIPYEKFTKKQTEIHFQWVMSQKTERIQILQEYLCNISNEKISLDLTPSSLVTLWRQFEDIIEYQELSINEIQKRAEGKIGLEKNIITNSTQEWTLRTKALIYDISLYLGEVFVTNNASIHWGYLCKPKKLDGVNQPILLGFKADICVNPISLISVATLKSKKEKDSNRLLTLYNTWLEYVE